MSDFLRINDLTAVGTANLGDEFLGYKTCAERARFDANRQKVPASVTDEDIVSYFIAINTWIGFTSDTIGNSAARSLRFSILRSGLTQTIEDANYLYDLYRADPDFWAKSSMALADVPFDLWSWADVMAGPRDAVLNVLCYLRRFVAPMFFESLKQASLDKFLSVNDRNRDFERNSLKGNAENVMFASLGLYPIHQALGPITPHLLDALHSEAAKLFSPFPETHAWDQAVLDGGYYSNGTVSEGTKILMDKLLLSSPTHPLIGTSMLTACYHSGWYTASSDIGLATFAEHYGVKGATSKIVCVPKSYKSARVIAEESAVNAFIGQSVNKFIWGKTNVSEYYDPSTQAPNRADAIYGSLDGHIATIDSSSASDSVSKELLRLVMPPRVYNLIMEAASTHALVGNKSVKLYIALTSGTGLTFTTETIVFIIIVRVAYSWYTTYTGEELLPFHVFGDDITIDARVYDLVVEIMTECGFVVNLEKSYSSGTLYRESCGVEAYHGYHWDATYYPRSGVVGSTPAETVARWTELQRKLYYPSPSAARFMEMCTKLVAPWMTISKAGTNCTDLWGSRELTPYVKYSPYAEIVEVETPITRETIRYFRWLPLVETSYIPKHATLVNQPRGRKLSASERALLEEYRYLKWLREPGCLETVPFGDTEILVIPAREDVAALTSEIIPMWELR